MKKTTTPQDSSIGVLQEAVLKISDEGLNVTVTANIQAHEDLKKLENKRQSLTDSNRELLGKLEQILIHCSLENQDIAKSDAKFGADELQAIRIKTKQALNKAKSIQP